MKFISFLTVIFFSLSCVFANKGNILITGGNGYIGLSTCRILKENDYTPISIDNSSNSEMPTVKWGPIEKGDILDKKWLHKIFKKYRFIGVIHLAAKIYVPESVEKPLLYYKENVEGLLNILDLCVEFGVQGIVFASTSAVYGNLETDDPVAESHPLVTLSPYAETKLIGENLLKSFFERYKIPVAILRYFNVSGIDKPTGNLDGHSVHLIPCLFKLFQKPSVRVQVNGTDYQTRDGTCIRDYVHVVDVAEANIAALKYIFDKKELIIANIGSGQGYSVNEVVKNFAQFAKREYATDCMPRRPGDVPIVVADISIAKQKLNWKPKNSELENIVKSYY